ncbi:Methyltransferase domain-containing protein [Caloramator quimbayensis]|uniref:Methyltransferase domain-containing protein n=1 Tax=Caloramator quimbayensis TaxID=1147123 RepID=A0A1T4X7Z5_9CLOT|nr:SAM-dependent methyltransferase [Caloramator quimbayensis]SKA85185.1 Methyltransferase domain-containing protein [Caloramator quimbayensis]
MKKQSVEKINFMLQGMINRAFENEDFLKKIYFSFKSGLKEYKGIYDIEKKIISFNGKNERIEFSKLSSYICDEALKYDSLEFSVEERGKTSILYADNKGIKIKQSDDKEFKKNEEESATSQILNRKYYINISEASPLLKEIGILTSEGKVKNDMIRKYNQIDHFVELIDEIIDDISDTDVINIVDCGCGKSYLSFVLNFYIKEKKKKNCYFIGIDRSEKVIQASRDIAKRLGYKNMEFICEDINSYIPDRKVDMVISLHACDIATDMALGLAIRTKARSIVCVPCCHKELLEQYEFKTIEPIIKHGIFKARFADILTDGIRALLLEGQGYKVSVVEYISPLETPKNLLIRARKVSEKNIKAVEEYKILKKTLNIYPYLERYINI